MAKSVSNRDIKVLGPATTHGHNTRKVTKNGGRF